MTQYYDGPRSGRFEEVSTMGRVPRPQVEVSGWASDNHSVDDVPAVIVNPEANALTLMSWGIGQLQQCNVLLDALSNGEASHCYSPQVTAGVLHFSRQAESLLLEGISRLRGERTN